MVFGVGEFNRLGEVARELGGTRCLLVADPGMLDAGYAQEATRSLKARRMGVHAFHEFKPNPDSSMAEAGASFAAPHNIDLIVALGHQDMRLDVPGIYMWRTTFDGTNYAQGAAIGILMLVSVSILVIPYLVRSMRTEAEL